MLIAFKSKRRKNKTLNIQMAIQHSYARVPYLHLNFFSPFHLFEILIRLNLITFEGSFILALRPLLNAVNT